MSPPTTPIPHPIVVPGGPGREDMIMVASAGVHADVAITLHMRTPDDLYVSLLFGSERFTLEFYDVESLERLRDLADEGARRLRAASETDTPAEPADDSKAVDQSAELARTAR
ncbi:MAG: hypothetical protein GEV28_24585 [Actinophytocola sp.]|uniref:hypothetical protein n=1 Tax=Actinophytocola sp. TaxID=1872138 RepID=UPI00132BCD31|nr:hypothetical protein [Actinophytocola sp.]MPZ83396.1 hypothetical protein [Actinophytocola sp.]